MKEDLGHFWHGCLRDLISQGCNINSMLSEGGGGGATVPTPPAPFPNIAALSFLNGVSSSSFLLLLFACAFLFLLRCPILLLVLVLLLSSPTTRLRLTACVEERRVFGKVLSSSSVLPSSRFSSLSFQFIVVRSRVESRLS